MPRTASCACGALSITLTSPPRYVSLCNCLQCQRRTGSAFGLSSFFSAESASISGDHRTYIRSGQHGRTVEQHFCPSCGTTVFWYGSMAPGMVAVAVGCFAEPTFPAPTLAAWCESKHTWLSFPSTVKTLDQQKA